MGKNFFGEKLQKFANLGVKIEENRVKCIKICTFLGNSFLPHLFFPTPHTLIWQNIHLWRGGVRTFLFFFEPFTINAIQYVNVTAVQLFFYGGRLLQHSAGQK